MLQELLEETGEDFGPGKFEGETPITLYLYRLFLDGDNGDDDVTFGDCDGANRYGKRILWFSSTGFVSCIRYASVFLAEQAMELLHDQYDEVEDF